MAKKKLGRPKIINNPKKKYIIYVDHEVYSFFQEHGSGSVSRGMRAVQSALTQLAKSKDKKIQKNNIQTKIKA